MAQFETGKEYRIKDVKNGLYMNAANNEEHQSGPNGGVTFIALDEDNANQKFTFEDAGNGAYYFKVNNNYIYCQAWNVDALASKKSALTLEAGEAGSYYIKNGENYFKTENVNSVWYPYGDAPKTHVNITTFIFEEVGLPMYTVTYNYNFNGDIVKTVENTVTEGTAYPNVDLGLYALSYEGVPTGNVTKDTTISIDVTVGEYPFEYAASYNEIGDKWYNLIMHSNWNTGSSKYRTYLSHSEGATTLGWGTERSLTNPGDKYFWAFVGNPINGFRVINKAKGDGYVLSSNGSANPLVLEEATLATGYNTTWNIAPRKYDVTNSGDYIREGAWFCLKHTNNNYINANAGNGNVAFWSDNDNGSGILAVKPLEIKEAADIATYYSENHIIIPEGMGAEVYYATELRNNGTTVHLEAVEGDTIYKETGIIVMYETDVNVVYAPEITANESATAISGNLLKGSVKSTVITKDANTAYYVLGMINNEAAFGQATSNVEGQFINAAYKAYLEVAGASQSTSLRFDFGGTTGIEQITENGVQSTAIYDLQGRRVSEITEKGIYIVGGKKVLVK